MTLTVWTVGHSTRPLPEFLELLDGYRIELVADVRRFPGSRSQPQYQQTALEPALNRAGIDYSWLPDLGGRRPPIPDTLNTTWRHPSFRGYADHMAGQEFAAGIFELVTLAWGLRTAVMCAEILWWRCHRRMIADVLVSLGGRVIHIMDANTNQIHRLRPPAHLVRGVLSYRPEVTRRRTAHGEGGSSPRVSSRPRSR
jgi:uncharacterized protein (DUF488 family)